MARADEIGALIEQSFPGARVTSTGRTRAQQDALIASGATKARNSQHLTGNGLDVVLPRNVSPAQVRSFLNERGIDPGEFLNERGGRGQGTGAHLHIGLAPKGGGRTSTGGGTSFDRAKASRQQSGPSMQAVYQAYRNTGRAGGMTASDAAQFERAVLDGHVMLPRGAQLRVKPASPVLPRSVVEAYNSHRMDDDPEARAEVKRAVDAGEVSLPRGLRLQAPEARSMGERLGMGTRSILEGAGGLIDVVAGPANALVNALPGEQNLTTTPFRNLGRSASDAMGLATPESDTESLYDAIIQGGTQGLATAGAGGLAAGAKGATGVIGEALAANPVLDTISGAVSGASQETARQAGAGPVGQVVAGLAGGFLPVGAAAATSRIRAPKSLPEVVESVPRAAVVDEAGNLTPEGQEIAARHNVTPEEVVAAYEAPPRVQEATANDQMPEATARAAGEPAEATNAEPVGSAAVRKSADELNSGEAVRFTDRVGDNIEITKTGADEYHFKSGSQEGYYTGDQIDGIADVARLKTAEPTELPPRSTAAQPSPVAPEALPATALARVQQAESFGFGLSKGQATQDFPTQVAEQNLRKMDTPQGEEVRQWTAKNAEDIKAATQEFTKAFDDPSISNEQRGAQLQEAIQELRNSGKAGVSALYKKADEIAEKVGGDTKLETEPVLARMREIWTDEAVPDNVRNGLRQLAAEYGLIGENPVTIEGETSVTLRQPGTQNTRQITFTGPPKTLDVATAERFRQRVGDMWEAGKRNTQESIKPLLEDALTKKVLELADSDNPDVGRAYSAARKAHQTQKQTFAAKDVVQDVVDWKTGTRTPKLKPEAVVARVFAKTSELRRIKAVLLTKPTPKSRAMWRGLQAHGLATVFEKAMVTNGNLAGEVAEVVSGAKLNSAVKAFGADKLQVLLDPEDFNAFMKLKRSIGDATIPINGAVPVGSAPWWQRLVGSVDNKVTAAFAAIGTVAGGPVGTAIGGGIGKAVGGAVEASSKAKAATATMKGVTGYTPEAAAADAGPKAPSAAAKAGSAVKRGGATTLRAFIDTYGSPRILAPVLASTTGAQQ